MQEMCKFCKVAHILFGAFFRAYLKFKQQKSQNFFFGYTLTISFFFLSFEI
jgi:hypothetical protein